MTRHGLTAMAWRLRTSWRRATPATPSGSATCRFPTKSSATWRWRKASWMTRRGLTAMAWRLRTSWRRATPATPSGSATCRFPTTSSATWRWRKASWMTRTGLPRGLAIAKLAAGDPGNTEWQRDLSVSYESSATWRWRKASWMTRRGLTATAWRLRTSWRRATPATPSGSATCRFPTNKLGDVAVAQGKLDDAARAYRDGLAIARQAGGGRPRQHRVAARPVGFLRQARRRGGGARQAG